MPQPKPETLTVETICTLLSSAMRRAILHRLRRVERTTTRELGLYLAGTGRTADLEASSEPGSFWIALVHDHLPRLDDHGVVDYGGPDGDVLVGPTFADLEPFVARCERCEPE